MPNPITLRSKLTLGAGNPKICIPLTGKNNAETMQQAKQALASTADILEWRVDFFAGHETFAMLQHTLEDLCKLTPTTPILFTCRTKKEGGESSISATEYVQLNLHAIESKMVDLVDIELRTENIYIKMLVQAAKKNDTVSVLSSHDFTKTPTQETLFSTLVSMRAFGADIPKIAVMPNTPADVLVLLSAADEYTRYYQTPLVAISMGRLGAISRVSGQLFGSCFTFCTASTSSAPGQLTAKDTRNMQTLLYPSV